MFLKFSGVSGHILNVSQKTQTKKGYVIASSCTSDEITPRTIGHGSD